MYNSLATCNTLYNLLYFELCPQARPEVFSATTRVYIFNLEKFSTLMEMLHNFVKVWERRLAFETRYFPREVFMKKKKFPTRNFWVLVGTNWNHASCRSEIFLTKVYIVLSCVSFCFSWNSNFLIARSFLRFKNFDNFS